MYVLKRQKNEFKFTFDEYRYPYHSYLSEIVENLTSSDTKKRKKTNSYYEKHDLLESLNSYLGRYLFTSYTQYFFAIEN